ncbi:MAG: TonB C-terminal domain-containing protein, partial [bacterium]
MNNYPQTYKDWIILSVSLHIVLILMLIISSRVNFNRPIAIGDNGGGGSINVDMVGLPNVLKKDIPIISTSTEVVEQIRETRKDEMILPDVKKITKAKKDLLENMKKDLQKEKTYLAKIKIIKGIKQSIQIGKATEKTSKAIAGNGTGSGKGRGSGDGNMPANPYFNTMKDLIRSYWKVPRWINPNGLNALIMIKIAPDGNIYKIEITKASGNQAFDNLAYNSVK